MTKMQKPTTRSAWRSFFVIGGAAALTAAVLGIIEIAIEISGSSLTSTPTTIIEWFTMLQNEPVLGLAILGIFESAFFPLTALMFLALYFALRRTSESLTLIAFLLNLIGAVVFLATNAALSLLSLSSQYAAAGSDAERSVLLAAGQAVLSMSQGTGSNMTFLFGSIAGLIVSVVMLKSKVFSRTVAGVGIVANVLGVPGPALGLTVWAVNGILMLVWIVLVGRRLLQLRNPKHLDNNVSADREVKS